MVPARRQEATAQELEELDRLEQESASEERTPSTDAGPAT